MSGSNVRSIDALAALHQGLLRLSDDWDKTLQEVRTIVYRTQENFTSTQPAYWRHQSQLAERELTEAKDNLARKRAVTHSGEQPSATEAVARVRKAEQRLRVCEQKRQTVRACATEVSKACDDLLGPLADVRDQCDTVLPQAARELAIMIDQLRLYAEQAQNEA